METMFPLKIRTVIAGLELDGIYEDWGFYVKIYRAEYWSKYENNALDDPDEQPLDFIARRLTEQYRATGVEGIEKGGEGE